MLKHILQSGKLSAPLESAPYVYSIINCRILGVMPLSALFILFDFVVHNPNHRETRSNLALLDVAAGYFSRLEYATGGSLPSSLLSDFAHIARHFVRDVQSRNSNSSQGATTQTAESALQTNAINNANNPSAFIPVRLCLSRAKGM